MAVNTQMGGKEIDKTLKAFYEAQNADNNGKILYIRRGKLAFEDPEVLFDVTELE